MKTCDAAVRFVPWPAAFKLARKTRGESGPLSERQEHTNRGINRCVAEG